MNSRAPLFVLLLILSATLVACGSSYRGGSGDDDDSASSDDDDDDDAPVDSDGDGWASGEDCNDSDASINPGTAETCDDEIDNDCDELVDCDDQDCESEMVCTLPTEVGHWGQLVFNSNLKFLGVESCTTVFEGDLSLEPANQSNDCAECDATYSGPVSYPEDSCGPLYKTTGNSPPSTMRIGLRFDNIGESITAFGVDDQGVWSSLGTATEELVPGSYVLTRTDPVDVDGLGSAGTLDTTLTYDF